MDSNASQPDKAILESPFDPFLARFLSALQAFDTGFSPQSNSASVADRLDVDPAFIEALTVSARRRRFIEPFYAPAHRNTLRWRLSSRGEQFLSGFEPPVAESDE
jgi:hypothetical protein